jgi:glutaredoxin domain-containing cysteine-rich protein 1
MVEEPAKKRQRRATPARDHVEIYPRELMQRLDDGGVSAAGSPEFDVLSASRDPVAPPPSEIQQRMIDDGKSANKARGRVVVYLTSIRGIRKTYEDCCDAATILSGYGVRVDERDLSMHAGYKHELRDALGISGALATPGLPQVFVDGRHLGGAEEVRRMHESGGLGEVLVDCEAAFVAESCHGCGGLRFLPCFDCSGTGAFRTCTECNENGLVRCPICE